MDILLKNGLVVSGQGVTRTDVLVQGETIAALGRDLAAQGVETVDCSGLLLFPGFIDGHTHFDLEVAGTVTADNFATGTRSALRGGTTTVVDFAAPNKGETLAHGLARWREKAKGAACDYGFHMTIDDWNPAIAAELGDMLAQGIPSFKMYLTYPAMMIGDRDVYHALLRLRELGGIAGVHCENAGLIDALIENTRAAGDLSPRAHPRTRPDMAEAEAVSRLLWLAQAADAPVIVVHLSTAAALEEIRAARRRGQRIYIETCPHYLILTDDVYDREPFLEGARFVCAPPLRKTTDQEVLWQALAAGEIDTVATDHCAFTLDQKRLGEGDFTKIPGGLPGVEHRGILLYAAGVAAGRIDVAAMCRLLAENPAKLYGCFPRKGIIAPGSDADLVLLDPAGTTDLSDTISAAGYSPYQGTAAGAIRRVYLRGHLAADGGKILAGAWGQYIPRSAAAVQ